MPGTSLEEFEDFVRKLPDKGTGRRIIYPSLGYQNYVGKMTLEEAKLVSKYPIGDQIGPNDPMKDVDADTRHKIDKRWTRHQHNLRAAPDGHQYDRRVDPGLEIDIQDASPLHLNFPC